METLEQSTTDVVVLVLWNECKEGAGKCGVTDVVSGPEADIDRCIAELVNEYRLNRNCDWEGDPVKSRQRLR